MVCCTLYGPTQSEIANLPQAKQSIQINFAQKSDETRSLLLLTLHAVKQAKFEISTFRYAWHLGQARQQTQQWSCARPDAASLCYLPKRLMHRHCL